MQKKIWIALFILGMNFSFVSCSIFKNRQPASERDTLLAQINNEILDARPLITTDSAHCHLAFNTIYQKLFNIAGDTTYFDASDLKAIDESIQETFETRLALKEGFRNFAVKNSTDHICLTSAQEVFKALRYVEDYLIELRMTKENTASTEYVNLKGSFPYFLVNPKYAAEFKSYEDLKSGDVILSRGNAYSSAAIARLALSDYQFSHLSFVYQDQASKDLFTTEAHIEIGSVTAPLIEHINDKNARSVVFRHHDPDLAGKASKFMFERVKKQQDTGKNIEYDFSMNHKEDTKLFCSEIISAGFKKINPDSDYLPRFKSKFSPGMIPFLNDIGIPVNTKTIDSTEAFAPGDIQFDPDFELVAEWRNPKKLEDSRMKDFILTKLYERMELEAYKIDPNLKMDILARELWLLRRSPLIKKFIEKKVSLSMNPTQFELFMALDKIGDAFYKSLEVKAIEYDHPMTPKEIYAAIDEFIKKDREQYRKFIKGHMVAKPAFHLLFHP